MRKRNLMLSLAFALTTGVCASAQTYAPTDGEGNRIYYKLMSAYPAYEGKCLADNYGKDFLKSFNFIVDNCTDENYAQEWEFIVANAEKDTYYLRNRKTRRYISTKGTWNDFFMGMDAATTRQSTGSYTLEPLNANQVAIKYNDGTSDKYVASVDVTKPQPYFDIYSLPNSRWAWYVATRSGVPVSIDDIIMGNVEDVSVNGNHIVVTGADTYSVYDVEGRRIPADATLTPGIYIVKTSKKSHKVVVK